MPVNPNIALGVQQQQPVNMLGQMGQMMALKAASQEMQSNEEMRNLFAGGANFDDPDFQKRGYMANPKAFQELLGKRATTNKTQMEALGKEVALRRDAITNINTPEDYLKWHDANHQGSLGAFFKSAGISPSRESIIAQLNQPGGLDKLKRESALGATELQKQLMQTERTYGAASISAGPGNRQATLAEAEAARKQKELDLIRGILTGNERTPPATSNVPMGGGGGGPTTGASSSIFNPASANVLANQVAPPVATPAPVNGLLNPPAGQTGVAPVTNRVDQITQQITQLAKIGGPVANQAMEGLVKEYNILNPAGKIEIGGDGVLRTINERSGVSRVVTGADGQPVMGKVAPVTKDIVDPTDPSGKRMITVEVNTYKAGTGLGDGTQPAPAGVLGVATSQIPANYMRDPNNPQGVIPVPGGPKDPNANIPLGYRPRADGTGQEFIPGGPQDPAVKALQVTDTLSAKELAARNAKFPQATSALKSFEAKTTKFERDIAELIENKKGLDEITGFLAGRTDLSALTNKGRRALALFNTITAKGGFSELQDMRNASPTGGALGNVSNQEGKQLIDSFGALSRTQSGADLRKSLITAQSDLQNLKTRMREAYDLTYEYRLGSGGAGPALPSGFVAD